MNISFPFKKNTGLHSSVIVFLSIFFLFGTGFIAYAAETDDWIDTPNFTLPISGYAWKKMTSVTNATLAGVALLSSNDAWAVGDAGTILHYDGTAWTSATSPTTKNLWAIAFAAVNDGWAVGDSGAILHYDGTAWTNATSPTQQHLLTVRVVAKNDIWIVGEGGTILHYDGTAWTNATSPTTAILYGLSFATANDGWAVGDSGTILHYDGTAWTNATSPTSIILSDVAALDATHVVAVGDEGVIVRFDGTSWESATGEGNDTLLSIAMLSPTSGWIVGDNGTILETRDGETWTAAHSPVTEALLRVKIDANKNGWIVGTNGTMLALQPTYATNDIFTSKTNDRGAPMTFTTIRWNATTPAGTTMQFQLASNTDNTTWNFIGPDGTANTWYTLSEGSAVASAHTGHRYIRYRASLATNDASSKPLLRDVTVSSVPIATPPAPPTLTTPVDANTVRETPVTFVWAKSTDATSYELQVDTANDFSHPFIDVKKIDARIITPVATWKDGTYFWRVRAVNAQGVSDWTPSATFTIALPLATPPPDQKKEEVQTEPQPSTQPTPPAPVKTIVPPTEPATTTPEPPAPVSVASPEPAPGAALSSSAPSSVTPSAETGGGGSGFVAEEQKVAFPLTVTTPALIATDRPSFRGTTPFSNTVAGVLIDGQMVTTTTLDAQGVFFLDLPIRLPDGDHTLQLLIQGTASLPVVFVIDTRPPLPPVATVTVIRQHPSAMEGFIASAIQVTGTVFADVVAVTVMDAGLQTVFSRTAPTSGFFTMTIIPPLATAGTYGLRVASYDAAGNAALHTDFLSYALTNETIVFACSDGRDNDADELVDYPNDPGCNGSLDATEDDGVFTAIAGNRAVKAVTESVAHTAAATVVVTKKIAAATVKQTTIVAKKTEEVVQASAPVVVPTLTVVAPAAVAVNPATAANLPMIPKMVGHAFAWLFSALGIKKKRRNPWGIVYDAITKEPIGLAIVRLFDATTKQLLATQVTDKEGRFEFLPNPGSYTLSVTKTPYTFPSTLVTGREDNERFDIYHGETVVIANAEQALQLNIPIDPEDLRARAQAVTFFARVQRVRHLLTKASLPLLVAGTIVSVIFYAFAATRYNLIILLVYMAIAAYQTVLSPKAVKSWGTIFDAVTLTPVPLALVHIIDPQFQRVLKSRLSDYHGRFAFLPDPGTYQLRVVKQGYSFPAATLPSHTKYKHPYRGEALTISKKQPIVSTDIPLDPILKS